MRGTGGVQDGSLVVFTVAGQAAVGTVWALLLVRWLVGPGAEPGLVGPLIAAGALMLAAGAASLLHLGSPRKAWRAAANVGRSWLSREVVLVWLFTAAWVLATLTLTARVGTPGCRATLLAVVAVTGLGLAYAMARVYRLRTVPAWASRRTLATFLLTATVLGSLIAALASTLAAPGPPGWGWSIQLLGLAATGSLVLELVLEPGIRRHRHVARKLVDPGLWPDAAPRWATIGRPVLLVTAAVAALAAVAMTAVGYGSIGMAPARLLLLLALATATPAEVMGRVAFYSARARVGA